VDNKVSFSFHARVWRGCNSKLRVRLIFHTEMLARDRGATFMRARKHLLDYDFVTLAFLVIGIAAVELLALII
jgi:hypothetical protein